MKKASNFTNPVVLKYKVSMKKQAGKIAYG
jgi:hypothetical protein